jgi:hypothetical protein
MHSCWSVRVGGRELDAKKLRLRLWVVVSPSLSLAPSYLDFGTQGGYVRERRRSLVEVIVSSYCEILGTPLS